MQDHFSAVTSLSFTPEGDRLLTAGRDKVAILWDLPSHKKLATVPVYEAVEGERVMQTDTSMRTAVCNLIPWRRSQGLPS